MTDYEQFQQFFQKHGVPHTVVLDATATPVYQPVHPESCHLLVVAHTEYWFGTTGRYLGLRYDDAFGDGHWLRRKVDVWVC